jgi:hypothetical protein
MMLRAFAVAWALVTVGSGVFAQNTPTPTTGDFGAKYASLLPEQRALVDDWIRRFSAIVQKGLKILGAIGHAGFESLPKWRFDLGP